MGLEGYRCCSLDTNIWPTTLPSWQAYLRSWELQGSEDGVVWKILRVHENDESISSFYGTGRWEIDGTSTESTAKVCAYAYVHIAFRGMH